jgi:DHA1 family multidrug resistance protein-like MFS transporter
MSHNPHFHRHIRHGRSVFPKNVSKLPKAIKRISFIFLVYMFGWGITIPFVSIYFKQILGTYTSLGMIQFFMHLLSMMWCIPYGEFIDKVKKKWMLSKIFLFYIVMGPWYMMLNGFFSILTVRLYHGALMSSLWTTADAYIRTHSPKSKTAESIGFFDSIFGIGIVLGCIAGGFLLTWIGFKIFWAVTICSLIAFILAVFTLPDQKRNVDFMKGIKAISNMNFVSKEFKTFLNNKELVKLSVLSFLMIMAGAMVNLLLPLFVYEMGSNYIFIGLIVAAFHFPRVFESFFSRIADKNSKKTMILIGATYAVAFFLLVFFTESLIVLFILSFFISLSFATISPSIEGAATTIIPRKKVGELSGILRTIKMAAEGLGPLFGALIADVFGVRYVFLFGAILMVLLFIFALGILSYKAGDEDLITTEDPEVA